MEKSINMKSHTYYTWRKHLRLLFKLSIYFLFFIVLWSIIAILISQDSTFKNEFDYKTIFSSGLGFLFIIFSVVLLIFFILILSQVTFLLIHDHEIPIGKLHNLIFASSVVSVFFPWISFIMIWKTLKLLKTEIKIIHEQKTKSYQEKFDNKNVDILFHW